MQKLKFGILGIGNMGSAILTRIIEKKFPAFSNYYIFDINEEKISKFQNLDEVIITKDEVSLIIESDIILIAVKPQIIDSVIKKIEKISPKGKIFISIAAGVPLSFFKKHFSMENYFVRVMPNINFLVGEGAAGITLDDRLDEPLQKIIQDLFACSGKYILCKEEYLDVVTGLSGSGPAYIFMVIEALADGAVKMGLQREKAYLLAAQTVIGAGKMVLETKLHPGELKDMVTSPGGTTIEAIAFLERGGVRSYFIDAVEVATNKSKALHSNSDNK